MLLLFSLSRTHLSRPCQGHTTTTLPPLVSPLMYLNVSASCWIIFSSLPVVTVCGVQTPSFYTSKQGVFVQQSKGTDFYPQRAPLSVFLTLAVSDFVASAYRYAVVLFYHFQFGHSHVFRNIHFVLSCLIGL